MAKINRFVQTGKLIGISSPTLSHSLSFTATPIHNENQINKNTTADVFGIELDCYSIADGIRDRNVLGFSPYQVSTFRYSYLRQLNQS